MIDQTLKTLVVVRSIIRSSTGEILLVKRTTNTQYNPGKWELPGKKLAYGENLPEAIERAITTELSISIKMASEMYYCHSRFVTEEGKYKHHTYIEITAEADFIAGNVKLTEEHLEYIWIDIGNIFTYDLSTESRNALAVYVKREHTKANTQKLPIILAARALIKNNKSQYLFVKRSKAGSYQHLWELPGGRLSSFEGLDDHLTREVFEETSLVIKITQKNIYTNSYIEKQGIYTGYTYINIINNAVITAGRIKLSDEHCEFRWVDEVDIFELDLVDYLRLPLTEIFLKRN